MVKDNTYNGWTNRETWLVNLWYGDSFGDMVRNEVEDGVYAEDVEAIADGFSDEYNKKEYVGDMANDMAERYEQWVLETIQEELDKLSGFLSDFLNLELINWYELGREVVREVFEV
jgi:hypothetical protein